MSSRWFLRTVSSSGPSSSSLISQKESFFLYLFWEEFQQREKCIDMLKLLMKVPKTVLQDEVQRWYERTGGGWNQKEKRRRREPKFHGTGWKASPAEQSAEIPASPDMKGPVCTACRCGAGRRLIWRITCWCGAGRSLTWRVACWSDVGRSLSLRIACRRSMGKRLSTRVTCPGQKSCVVGTDLRVYALCRPRVWSKLRDQWLEGPKVEQRTFEQVQEVVACV